MEHERCTAPFTCTEHAPHWATPQPYLVPVRPTCSRITHKSGVSGSACTSSTLPLMLSFAIERPLAPICCCAGPGRKVFVAPLAEAKAYRSRKDLHINDACGASTRAAARKTSREKVQIPVRPATRPALATSINAICAAVRIDAAGGQCRVSGCRSATDETL